MAEESKNIEEKFKPGREVLRKGRLGIRQGQVEQTGIPRKLKS